MHVNFSILHPHNGRCCNELAVLPEIAKSVLAVHGLCTQNTPLESAGFQTLTGARRRPRFVKTFWF